MISVYIPVSEKNRKEQILFPLFHTENNFLSFFITEIVKSIILLISCSHYTTCH